MKRWTRRELGQIAAALSITPGIALTENEKMLTRPVPASGEAIPIIGLGTYDVFDIRGSQGELATRTEIVSLLAEKGGSLIDSSPMYNRSEQVVGDIIRTTGMRDELFIATKVWTDGKSSGAAQMQRSAEHMQAGVIDLMQVHNLRDLDIHMGTIREWQQDGRIRYNGITHYTAGAHRRLAEAMQRYKPEFIQINYSLGEREAEEHLLPLAQDLGIAGLINRPYMAGGLFHKVRGQELPQWAREIAESWGQLFLKFIITHPAVTCAIPATSKPHHMLDNLGAGFGAMPDADMRQKIAAHWDSL